MRQLNSFFFGEETISFSDALWFYGLYLSIAIVGAVVMFSIY